MSMLTLIKHHERRSRYTEYNAIADCHTRGLNSVMLHDEPGNRIRMFITDFEHDLCYNRGVLRLGLHQHHCAITLVKLFGEVYNDVYALTPHKAGSFSEYKYTSAIHNEGKGSLVLTGRKYLAHPLSSNLLTEDGIDLMASEIHTIYVPAGRVGAWLVIEGQEDENYDPMVWTNGSTDLKGLYKKPTTQKVTGWFRRVREALERPTC